MNISLFREPIHRKWNEHHFLIGHGDGLGPGDRGYKFIKKVFSNRICQWLFARIHPNFGIWMANYWSGKSRSVNHYKDREYFGEEKEMLVQYCKQYLQDDPSVEYFIFGHRHLPLDIRLNDKSRYLNLGDWISYYSYAVFDGDTVTLKDFKNI